MRNNEDDDDAAADDDEDDDDDDDVTKHALIFRCLQICDPKWRRVCCSPSLHYPVGGGGGGWETHPLR